MQTSATRSTIGLVAAGSRGDLQPFVALALALHQAGHLPTVICPESEMPWVQKLGLLAAALPADMEAIMNSAAGQRMRRGSNPLQFFIHHLRTGPALSRTLEAVQAAVVKAVMPFDVLIFHPGMSICHFLASALHKKAILATPFPIVPTSLYPSILFYRWGSKGAGYNRLTHWLFHQLFWRLTRTAVRKSWPGHLPAPADWGRPAMLQHLAQGGAVLNAYSPLLFAPDPQWAADQVATTGSWTLTPPAFEPPPALVDFLVQGPPPVFLGFGSIGWLPDQQECLVQALAGALDTTGLRAIVQVKGMGPEWVAELTKAGRVFLAESVPHSWLLPQVCMVVHHGGAGTTAAGLLAGKPTVVVPQNGDQPAWGRRVHELGLGPRPIKPSLLNARTLTEAILFCQRPQVVNNAIAFGQKMRTTNSLDQAVEQVGKWIAKHQMA